MLQPHVGGRLLIPLPALPASSQSCISFQKVLDVQQICVHSVAPSRERTKDVNVCLENAKKPLQWRTGQSEQKAQGVEARSKLLVHQFIYILHLLEEGLSLCLLSLERWSATWNTHNSFHESIRWSEPPFSLAASRTVLFSSLPEATRSHKSSTQNVLPARLNQSVWSTDQPACS